MIKLKKEDYLDCRKILKSFDKNEYWTKFSSADIFYIINGKNKALFTFVEQFFGDSFGCQLFFNNKGFNYVHDILTVNSENVMTLCDCDCLCCLLVNKDELKEEEKAYLKKNKIKIMKTHNLLIYRFEEGHIQRPANKKEIGLLLDYLSFLKSIINNELEDILEAYRNGNVAFTLMDNVNYEYSIIYRPLPNLETFPKQTKVNQQLVDEFKNKVYIDDDCYVFTSYAPTAVKETGVRPLMLSFYYSNSSKVEYHYIIDSPKEYKEKIFGILYNVLENNDIPCKMIFNNRLIYTYLVKTLKSLNVECEFTRENVDADIVINELVGRLFETYPFKYLEQAEYEYVIKENITQIVSEYENSTGYEYLENNDTYVS